jgi:hypothetical protein
MSGHPKLDPVTGELFFFGYDFGDVNLRHHVVDHDGRLVRTVEPHTPRSALMHDFGVTATRVVFMDLPVVFDAAMFGAAELRSDLGTARFTDHVLSAFAAIAARPRLHRRSHEKLREQRPSQGEQRRPQRFLDRRQRRLSAPSHARARTLKCLLDFALRSLDILHGAPPVGSACRNGISAGIEPLSSTRLR